MSPLPRHVAIVFGSGSRATVAILIAVREPGSVPAAGAELHYRDIGGYLSRTEKLAALAAGADTTDPLAAVDWEQITPNKHGDWINQRSDRFHEFDPICEPDDPNSIFGLRSNGLKTNRDAWNYNGSRTKVVANLTQMVEFFNSEVDRFGAALPRLTGTAKARASIAENFVHQDPTKFSWKGADYNRAGKRTHLKAQESFIRESTYRPFFRQVVNADPLLNERVYQLPKIYPTSEITTSPSRLRSRGPASHSAR